MTPRNRRPLLHAARLASVAAIALGGLASLLLAWFVWLTPGRTLAASPARDLSVGLYADRGRVYAYAADRLNRRPSPRHSLAAAGVVVTWGSTTATTRSTRPTGVYTVRAPLLLAVVTPLALSVAVWWMLHVAARRLGSAVRPGLCRACGYDLRATPTRCPECGAAPAA